MSTDVETTPTHVSERELAERLSEILDRVATGEQVVVERDGRAIVLLAPAPEPKQYWTWGDLVHFLQHGASFDEEFARDVREVRESQGPARAAEWPA